jgi:hypothetical protein
MTAIANKFFVAPVCRSTNIALGIPPGNFRTGVSGIAIAR